MNEKNCEIFQKIKSVNFTKNNIDNLRNNSVINKEYENHIDINEHNHIKEITKNNRPDGDEYIDRGSSDNNPLETNLDLEYENNNIDNNINYINNYDDFIENFNKLNVNNIFTNNSHQHDEFFKHPFVIYKYFKIYFILNI